jgi:ABC-type multidrug transport system permease subunit
MLEFLAALTAFVLGTNIEYRSKSNAMLRPMPAMDVVWKVIGALSGVWLAVLFVWAFFVFTWWAVPLLFLGAATFSGFFYGVASRAAAAPLLSMVLMVIGSFATGWALYHAQTIAN